MCKNTSLVSIIVPIYNVESYLIDCLESIEAQTYDNIECILVVDGATDNSFSIAKEYCNTHIRFKVFYQENAGSGPARNKGVALSSGEFICFIDPDDWVEPDYVETLICEQRKGNYDLVVSQTIERKVNSKNKIVATHKNNKPRLVYVSQRGCRDNFPAIMFEHHYLDGPVCKLFKASIIKSNKIEFPPYRRSQDMVFNFRYYKYIDSFSAIPCHTYNVRCDYPPQPGRGRVFSGYSEIVAKIYLELKDQLSQWNIGAECNTQFHTWAFWYLYAYIIRCVDANLPYEMVKNEPFRTIIDLARPKLVTQRVVRFFLKLRMYNVVTLVIKIINRLK